MPKLVFVVVVLLLKCCTCVRDIASYDKDCNSLRCPGSTNATIARWLHPKCIACNRGCKNQSRDCPEETGEYAERSICRHAQTRSPGRVIPYTGSYLMVDQCPSQDGVTVLCDTLSTRLNGIYPVMSESGRIYINKECSYCNNHTETVPWDIVMVCPFLPLRGSYTPMVLESANDGPCDIMFQPQELYKSTAQCLQSVRIVDPCNDVDDWDEFLQGVLISYHAIPAPVVDIYRYPDIGAMGPIVFGNIYCANCIIVNNQWANESTSTNCSLTMPIGPNSESLYSFILNPAVLEMKTVPVYHALPEVVKASCGPNEFRHPSWTECRRVHCPEGHVRDREGRCQLYALSWILGKIAINIDLVWSSPGITVNTSTFETLPEDKKSNISTWLHGPFDDSGWNVSVHYVVRNIRGKPSKNVAFLKMSYSLKANKIDAAALYNNITKALSQRWALEISRQTISLHAKVASAFIGKDFSMYKLLWFQNRHASRAFYMSKLFFCNQVEIYEHEYRQAQRANIYIPFLKIYLYLDEYIIPEMNANTTYNSDSNGVRRICVDDVLASLEDDTDLPVHVDESKEKIGIDSAGEETDFVKSTSFGVMLCTGVLVVSVMIRVVCKRYFPRRSASTPDDVQIELSVIQTPGQLPVSDAPSAQAESELRADTAVS